MASAALTDFISLLQNNQGDADIITMLQSLKSEIDNRIQKAEEEIAQGNPTPPLITDAELALIQMIMPTLFQQAETALNDASEQLEQGKAELDNQQALLDSKKQELASKQELIWKKVKKNTTRPLKKQIKPLPTPKHKLTTHRNSWIPLTN